VEEGDEAWGEVSVSWPRWTRQRMGRRPRQKIIILLAASTIMLRRLWELMPRRRETAAWRRMWTSGRSKKMARPDVSAVVRRRDRRPMEGGTSWPRA